VQLLQQVLNFHMPFTPPPLVVDGIFGPKTKAPHFRIPKVLRSDDRR
jgi:hypothetical protein